MTDLATCPMCDGKGAIPDESPVGTDLWHSMPEYHLCPLCCGARSILVELAAAYRLLDKNGQSPLWTYHDLCSLADQLLKEQEPLLRKIIERDGWT